MADTPPEPAHPPAAPGADACLLEVLSTCIDKLTDSVLITEFEPLDEPGPRIVFANPAFCRQTGYAAEELIGRTPRLLQGPKTDAAELRRLGEALRRSEVVRVELVNYKRDGEEFFVEMEITPIRDGSGRCTHWVSVQRDVTARKQAELAAARRETQRSQSIGTLASGIAHDFNNIVAAILGNVAIARQDASEGRGAAASLDQINTAALRARTLIQRILAYGRREPEKFEVLALAPVVAEAAALLRSTLPSTVRLEVELGSESFAVRADATQLGQVVVNLGINAWQALAGDHGTIVIRVQVAPALADGADTRSGRQVQISVDDDGCGMDEETRLRAFDPYFTTKAIGVGTGLGLAVAWGIVTEHAGTIAIESSAGTGTVVRIELPIVEDAAPARAGGDAARPRAAQGAGRRVVYVDDDEVVSLMMEGLLVHAGFDVTTYNEPLRALEALQRDPGGCDIVVTDFNMPGLSGLLLAERLHRLRAELPIVVCSGYLSDALVADAKAAGVARLLRKEFAAEELTGLVSEVLEAAASVTS